MRLQSLSQYILDLLKQYAIKYKMTFMGIFGSFARHEESFESDLDLLVDFSETPSLISIIQMEQEISQAINIKIDLITKNSLNIHIKKNVLAEIQVVYEKIK